MLGSSLQPSPQTRGAAIGGSGLETRTPDPAALRPFLGMLRPVEEPGAVRARIDAAIEQAIAQLSWALRLVARPGLRFCAHAPDWISIQPAPDILSITFSSGIELRAPLGGPACPHRLPGGTRAEVRHFLAEGRLRTEITSDLGQISNSYEPLSDAELIGHVQLASQHLPLPVRYAVRMRRQP